MAKKNNHEPLICAIDRFENGVAVLSFGHGQKLEIYKKFLPKDAKEGDVLHVEFLTAEQKTKRTKDLAKAMLDEIFKGS
ncbi:MAG: hypothetical protein COX39_02855 [Candidatus Nealsonbacteria bacterium CG23_combo_of_CG06-09_8_20_14_all_40_13]|uniref:DUF3006 domain-containing protein n=1 Tax=Candidatus Nealsonbacteria bacterium CG23_combo_of_CG06-09_8_20_14_all_40_13 TaxID=1974724 RepID=A0A2G9YQF2_9BACT|nr:MAG: hypothetical protein COX39_02855 [Candidatus Nealsonbacteria bacterium CG23_combo_of_CG06-09_8_20_14_all_40_13]PIR71275.1 MAG: hypothetical protein COU44_00465 [Candidatus Nealsonbacteria bacterium CG10_big_fil_rev_8_21_14_0_10_40_24]PIU43462.1 MAG: hypothetical protein COS97_00780 [Candidatus Nealsonbacteria bacterium CG07_land_8_20_14_0_80_40_10]